MSIARSARLAAAFTPAVLLICGVAVSVTYPPERQLFKDGPNADLVRSRCQVCHSSDYVYTQPPLTKSQWVAEVKKMQGVYGATSIVDGDVEPIVDYLMTQNGKP